MHCNYIICWYFAHLYVASCRRLECVVNNSPTWKWEHMYTVAWFQRHGMHDCDSVVTTTAVVAPNPAHPDQTPHVGYCFRVLNLWPCFRFVWLVVLFFLVILCLDLLSWPGTGKKEIGWWSFNEGRNNIVDIVELLFFWGCTPRKLWF